MQKKLDTVTIGMRPIIRYLGLLVGIVAAAPSVFACLYLLFHPSEIISNPGGTAFPLVLGPLFVTVSVQWMKIGGVATPEIICLRGWFSTIRFTPDQLAHIRRIEYSAYNSNRGTNEQKWHYEVFDHNNESLGEIPTSLLATQGWDNFLQHLHSMASRSRKIRNNLPVDEARDLLDIPASEWEIEDIKNDDHDN